MIDTKKNLSIETLRGIAIILVVMGHVIGSTPEGAMRIDFPHPLRYFYLWIDYIQMPLFTAIAGWVYALKPLSKLGSFTTFTRKKALRLLVPMAVVGTLYFLVQYVMPGTNNKGELSQMWRIYVFPYTIYWYLPSLFLIFIIQWGIDNHRLMNNIRRWAICLVIAVFLSLINDYGIVHAIPNIFSFKGALGQLPYFLVGVGAYRFASQLFNKLWLRLFMWLSVLLGMILIQIVWFYPGEVAVVSRALYVVTLMPFLLLLLSMKWHNRFFVWVGGYAYTIYLLHGFGTSGGRIILKLLGVKAISVIFVFSSLISTLCPILVDKLASRCRIIKVLLLGKQ